MSDRCPSDRVYDSEFGRVAMSVASDGMSVVDRSSSRW